MQFCMNALCWLVLAVTVSVQGYDNFCIDRQWPTTRYSAYCHGMSIPAHKTRNFISEELRSNKGDHTVTRRPDLFDEEAWRDLKNTDPEAARAMLKQLPSPKWEGSASYDTHLHWSWQECQLVTSFDCGSETVCKMVTDINGNDKEVCNQEPKSCYMDQVVTESAFCSHEKLAYDVTFIPAPEDNDYPDRLAHGYELLPGEFEDIIVDNGVGLFHSATMSPQLTFRNPRNEYQVSRVSGSHYDEGSFPCRKDHTYHVGFTVQPLKRKRSISGNGFSLPVSFDGESINPLAWGSAQNADGLRHYEAFPTALRVQDYSSATMNEFALDTGDLFKNLVVRIQLYDKSFLAWPFARSTIYIREGEGLKQTLNAISDDQKVRRSRLWEIMLTSNGAIDPAKNLYRNYIPWFIYYPARLFLPKEALSYENQLKPGTDYQLKMTVYQRGSSLYHQACEDDPNCWDCQFYAGWGWFSPTRYESRYYSDESIDIDFTTPEDVNQRSWWPMTWNTTNMISGGAIIGAVVGGVLRMAGKR